MIGRLLLGLGYLFGAYVLFDAGAEELSRFFGELFAEAVIHAGNETEGNDHAA